MYIRRVSNEGRGAGWSSTRDANRGEFQSVKCCFKNENSKVKRPIRQSILLNFVYNFGRIVNE